MSTSGTTTLDFGGGTPPTSTLSASAPVGQSFIKIQAADYASFPSSGTIVVEDFNGIQYQLTYSSKTATNQLNLDAALEVKLWIGGRVAIWSPGNTTASVAITGQPNILSNSQVEAWIMYVANSEHTADEHMVVPLKLACGSIVVGDGFTIYGFSDYSLCGQFTVQWVWN